VKGYRFGSVDLSTTGFPVAANDERAAGVPAPTAPYRSQVSTPTLAGQERGRDTTAALPVKAPRRAVPSYGGRRHGGGLHRPGRGDVRRHAHWPDLIALPGWVVFLAICALLALGGAAVLAAVAFALRPAQ